MAVKKILKSLVLTDSAGKARTLRKFLGYSYTVMSTEGFLKDLPKSRIGIDEDYQPDYITVRGKGSLLAELRKATLNARRIFLATSPNLRGEFMARQLCEVFGVNPLSNCRMFFDEMTKDAVKSSLENARPINDKLADAFQAKQIIDKFVSHKVGDYLSFKIYRGVKVGRFRAMLLKLINNFQPCAEITLTEKFSLAELQILAAQKLNFSAGKTRLLTEQLFEGINFEKLGYGGLIACPDGGIKLSAENRKPAEIKDYLTDNQFKLYDLIFNYVGGEKISSTNECSELALMIKLESLGVNWTDVLAIGIASLLKRKYITEENSVFKLTELGRRVLNAVDEFFAEDFSVDSYKNISAQVTKIFEGDAEKISVIKTYCDEFNKNFNRAMAEFGDDAKPQDEPVVFSDEICDKCGSQMLIKHGRYGFFLACSSYPDCKNVKPYVNYLEQKCPKCGERLTRRDFGRGRSLYRCEHYPTCDFQTWDAPQNTPCKVCGASMFTHKFKTGASMFYCGNENCPSRENHPMNKILADAKKRSESRKKVISGQ